MDANIDWLKRILTCDLEKDRELYSEDELVEYKENILNEINE